MSPELQNYIPAGIMIVVAIAFACGTLLFQALTAQKGRSNPAQNSPYECGIEPTIPSHARFSVKFYLVAMMFIIFDIEVVFMYPWAVIFKEMLAAGPAILISMISFIGILAVGYVYALKKGAFDWKS
jgi:NADH-quinone oxidoreductase subunit A